ncbi:MAG: NAD-dependent epimerase/dehydratase family protein [Bacteroidota bacterium]
MQTILGAGGVIGNELATQLPKYTNRIRIVSRKPEKVNSTDELFAADLLDTETVDKAVEGSEVAYLVVGLPYFAKVWAKMWPLVMDNVIQACIKHSCKLVFLDNIYMYDPGYLDGMDEKTPFGPISKKGEVREAVVNKVLSAISSGQLTALIARAGDFYGPFNDNSVLVETVFKPLQKGGKANIMGNPNVKHSYTYTPDIGKALAILGNSSEAFQQTWHMPTDSYAPTHKEWLEEIAKVMKKKPSYRVVSDGMLSIMGLFSKVLREVKEMNYQNHKDYVFNSSKFEQQFNFKPTPWRKAIQQTVEAEFA